MKALSLMQPWATLIARDLKRIETRSWRSAYRGPLAIHASKTFPAWAEDCARNSAVFRNALGWPDYPGTLTQEWLDEIAEDLKALPLGAIVATCRLVDYIPTSAGIYGTANGESGVILPGVGFIHGDELAFGNYEPKRFAWILDEIKPLPVPIPAKGAQGLWDWNEMPEVKP